MENSYRLFIATLCAAAATAVYVLVVLLLFAPAAPFVALKFLPLLYVITGWLAWRKADVIVAWLDRKK